MISSTLAAVLISAASCVDPARAFVSVAGRPSASAIAPTQRPATSLCMSTPKTQSTLALSLEKPLGLILEESDDGVGGVIVTAVNEGGSAYESPDKERLVPSKIATVMGADVTAASFDEVMDAIVGAPSPLDIEFAVPAAAEGDAAPAEEAEETAAPTYKVGDVVTITVQQPETNKPDIQLEARVGDNLRKTLLAIKDIELYRGMKKKLGNCGGGMQCGWCAVELEDAEGVWGERSDYEAQKIGKNGSDKCRLACANNIVGPATVRTL
ncbi:hypothetical protein ACHAXT_009480 [Thalassiosira profunda]